MGSIEEEQGRSENMMVILWFKDVVLGRER